MHIFTVPNCSTELGLLYYTGKHTSGPQVDILHIHKQFFLVYWPKTEQQYRLVLLVNIDGYSNLTFYEADKSHQGQFVDCRQLSHDCKSFRFCQVLCYRTNEK